MMPKPVIRRKHLFDQFVSVTDGELIIISWALAIATEGPKPATRGGEWEPIKISLEIDLSAYFSKITTNPQPKV